MGLAQISVAAATAVVGYDLMQGHIAQQMGRMRVLSAIGCKGSAAAGDTKVDIFVDQTKVGEVYNSGTGFCNMDDVMPIGAYAVPPHSQIHLYVTDAPGTNPINIVLKWQDM